MPPRSTGGRILNKNWEADFLKALQETMLPNEAAKAAHVSRTFVFKEKRERPEFREKWEEIIENATDVLEQVAVRRAFDGSDVLMIFLLKARRPEVYRDNLQVAHEHHHVVSGGVEQMLDGKQPIQIEAARRREAAKLLSGGDETSEDVIESTAVDVEE